MCPSERGRTEHLKGPTVDRRVRLRAWRGPFLEQLASHLGEDVLPGGVALRRGPALPQHAGPEQDVDVLVDLADASVTQKVHKRVLADFVRAPVPADTSRAPLRRQVVDK